MNTASVTVLATIRARAGAELELRTLLLDLVPPTRREPGCLRYELNQSADQPGAFAFVECWRSMADLERHLATAHIQAALDQAKAFLAEPPKITLWNPIA